MAVALPLQPNLKLTLQLSHSNISRTPKSLHTKLSRTNRRRFSRPTRSAYHDNSSSDETTQPKQVPAEDDIQKIKMEVSPTVLKALEGQSQKKTEEDGLGMIERNRLKRAARFAATQQALPTTKPSITPFNEEDCNQIYEAFKSDMPNLQKPGNLDIDKFLQLTQQYIDLDFAMPAPRILIGTQNQRSLDENLIRGCVPSTFVSASLRNLGGLQFDKDKEWYSQRLIIYIVYNHLAEQMRIELDMKNDSRAENLASTIAQLEPLIMTVVAPELLVLYAFENSGFVPDGRIVRYEDGFIFPGKLKEHPEAASAQIQQYMDLTGQDNVIIFMKSRKNPTEDWCVIAPWSWFLGTILPDDIYNWVCGFSFLGAFIGALQFGHAGLEPIMLEAIVTPSLLLGIGGAGWAARWLVASKYDVSQLIRWPVVFPYAGLGAMGAVTGYKGCLPNRSCLLNLSLASVFGSLAFSSLVVLLGYSVGSLNAFSEAVVDFNGYFLVPLDMFSYSSFFTFLLTKLSIGSFREEMGNLEFVISPISLSGLLGLSFCCFQLLPVSRSDGARILAAIFGREAKKKISLAVQILLTACFIFKNPVMGFLWFYYIGFVDQYDDLFQREEVTEPPLYGKLLGLGLVSAALASFVPVQL